MDKYELEKMREMLEREYYDKNWTHKYRPSKWKDDSWETNYHQLPDWVDEVVKQHKQSKPKAKKKPVTPKPPKRKAVKKSSSVGGALAQTLNEIDA